MAKRKKGYEVKVSNEGSGYPPKMPRKAATEKAGHESNENPPAAAKHAGRKKSRKQRTAIMLAKARKGE